MALDRARLRVQRLEDEKILVKAALYRIEADLGTAYADLRLAIIEGSGFSPGMTVRFQRADYVEWYDRQGQFTPVYKLIDDSEVITGVIDLVQYWGNELRLLCKSEQLRDRVDNIWVPASIIREAE